MDTLRRALADRYAIELELGQGGMATVYLAEDRRHHRKVAIKVLKPELAASLGADRFLREIETAAQLTHPHILPLLDSGAAAGTLFYVMPFVEGESLRDRLTRERQLPLEDALQIAREVADALGYAHGHGVIHRDIKPENILLESSHAVVADFGIARAVSAAGGTRLTETGLAVGTPAYMSPEQASGAGDLDARSDVYALGCVLYEMLIGETPYTGPTPMAILARKLSERLPRVSVIRETVPPGVEAALEKALARTPADRWPTATAFAAALAHPYSPIGSRASWLRMSVGARPMLAVGGVPRWGKWAMGVVAVIAVGLLAAQYLRGKPLIITVSDITQVTNEPGVEAHPAVSPDGREVAFIHGTIGATPEAHLVIRGTANVAGGGEIRPVDAARHSDGLPTWTPDGNFVRFATCRAGWACVWMETGRLGGAARPLALPPRAQGQFVGGFPAWSPDGTRIAFVVRDTIFVAAAADTGARRLAVHPAGYSELHSLAWSPDGKWLAYVNGNRSWLFSTNVSGSSIWIVDTDGGERPRRVTTEDHLNVSPAWLDARHLLFISDRDGPRGVYVVAVGPLGGRGEPRIVAGVADPHLVSFSIGARKLAWAKLTVSQNVWSYPLGRSGPLSIRDGVPVTSGSQVLEEHDVSPDGRWLAFDSDRRGNMDLYRMPVGGGEPVALTADSGDEFDPRWSPDGTEVAFYTGRRDVRVMPSEGGASVLVADGGGVNAWPQWSPSGLDLAFRSTRTGRAEVWLVSRDSVGAVWRDAVQVTDFGCYPLDWTPDGSGVLCVSQDRRGLLVVSRQGRVLWRYDLTANGLLLHVTVPSAQFSRDGRTLYLAAFPASGNGGVWAMPAAGGPARPVVAFDDPAVVSYGTLSLGPDRLYLTVSQYESDIWVASLRW